MTNLDKLNVIVTGASGGIGNSIVEKLYEAGANVLATGTKKEKLNMLKKKFDRLKILPFDISQHDKIENFINESSELLGGNLNCLINKSITNIKRKRKQKRFFKRIWIVDSSH